MEKDLQEGSGALDTLSLSYQLDFEGQIVEKGGVSVSLAFEREV